jgi:hypothetical protein
VAYSFVLDDGRAGVAVWTPPTLSELRITDITLSGKDVQLSWIAPAGTTNVLQASSNISLSFQDISSNIVAGAGGQLTNHFVEVGGATNQPDRFYRVRKIP